MTLRADHWLPLLAIAMLAWTGIITGCSIGSDKESATTVPAPPSLAEQGLAVGTETGSSCLYYRGERKWCMTGWGYEDSWHMEYEGRDTDHVTRYWVYDHKDQVIGTLRMIVPGQWRAHVLACGLGKVNPNNPCEYVRDGRAVRVSRTVYHVYTHGGRRREVARGPDADAVAARKLVFGDCRGSCE